MKRVHMYILLVVAMLAALPAVAQNRADSTAIDSVATQSHSSRRFITPVKENTNKVLLPGKDVDDKLLEQYLTGDTLKALEEARQDSIKKAYTRYPKLTDMAIGLNFLDLLLGAFGQDHMNVDASFTLNMWNRLQPVVELGVGFAKSTPDDMNYTYKGKVSPFARIGANYNFTFKSSPDYQALLGLRLGGSIFKYDITDISYHNSYWGESASTEILGNTGRALWFEVVAGLKVKVWKQVSLGWMVRYHNLISENKAPQGKPWFIPGYGTRRGSIGLSFSAYYTIPMGKKEVAEEKTSIAEPQK